MALVKDSKADFICRTIKRVEGPRQSDFTVGEKDRALVQVRYVAKDRVWEGLSVDGKLLRGKP